MFLQEHSSIRSQAGWPVDLFGHWYSISNFRPKCSRRNTRSTPFAGFMPDSEPEHRANVPAGTFGLVLHTNSPVCTAVLHCNSNLKSSMLRMAPVLLTIQWD